MPWGCTAHEGRPQEEMGLTVCVSLYVCVCVCVCVCTCVCVRVYACPGYYYLFRVCVHVAWWAALGFTPPTTTCWDDPGGSSVWMMCEAWK